MELFQSLDWVDVYSGVYWRLEAVESGGFNPSTGLMFIPATLHLAILFRHLSVSIPRLG